MSSTIDSPATSDNHQDPSEPSTSGMTYTRRFTANEGPFDGIVWRYRSAKIANPDGTAVFALDNVEVPDTWSQVSTDIVASKYFRKAGVPQFNADGTEILDGEGNPVSGPETSVKQVVTRLTTAWMIWGQRNGVFATPGDAAAYRDEMAYMVVRQMGSPNSPQWFNTGLFETYGITEDAEGNYYYDAEVGRSVASSHKYERSAASACYILNVNDTLVGQESIMRHIEDAARLFKGGSGVGANYSTIRERGAALTGGGESSGLMSFLRVHDRAAGAIKSGGTTRRAAKMVIVDADHPDIEEFIWCKALEEKKVAALVAAGYSSDFNGEAYDTVSFQNGNNSVRLPAGFLDAVANDDSWALKSRRDDSTVKEISARSLWLQIAQAAWECADPGLQFDDLINDWNTVADTERLHGTNPCSEFTHVNNSSCNLASLNLVSFWDDATQTFDIDGFEHAVRLWTTTLEITVFMSHYPNAEVAKVSYEHRPLGLGFANLGAMLMRAGLAYDSDAARAAMGAVTALMHSRAYATSAELAATLGAFPAFEANSTSTLRVIRNHRRAAYGSLAGRRQVGEYEQLSVNPSGLDHLALAHTPFAPLSDAVLSSADEMLERAMTSGVRNAQVTVLAPTGTIGLQMGCDTTGVEPDFALVKMKKLAGGGYMQIVNNSVEQALRSLGYSDSAVSDIVVHLIGSHSLNGGTVVSTASLAAAGFTDVEIAKAVEALPQVTDLTWAFGSHIVGSDVYARLGADELMGGGSLLAAAGFASTDVQVSSKAICGHLTVEGAPGLRPEHLAVFDCAVECGEGTRSIAWTGHVRALGAVAPFLSGSTSKTINMSHTATVDDVAAAHQLSYDLGVKCVAIYRDGSKMSQPLNSAQSSEDTNDVVVPSHLGSQPTDGVSPTEFYHNQLPPRFKLPNMRDGKTWRFEIGGEEVYLRSGEYPDGSLGEIFLDWGKPGSTLRGMTAALSVAISQGLQHGVPLTKITSSLRGMNFEPHGMVVGSDNLKMADSLVDAVVRILGHHYLGDATLVQVPSVAAVNELADRQPNASAAAAAETSAAVALPADGQKLFGEKCANCGSERMMRNGSCKVCLDCAETTGCS